MYISYSEAQHADLLVKLGQNFRVYKTSYESDEVRKKHRVETLQLLKKKGDIENFRTLLISEFDLNTCGMFSCSPPLVRD